MRKIFLIFFLLSAAAALAQDSCPARMTRDSLPGKCGLYKDAAGDSVCDLSQTVVEAKAPAAPARISYHFWEIMVMTGILGLATELWLKRRPKYTLPCQTIWNWLLLLSFLGSALSGLYFVMPFDSRPALGFNISYWHAVISLIFIAVAMYHTIRRFASMLGRARPCIKKNGECPGGKGSISD
jgi:hypothetical protein